MVATESVKASVMANSQSPLGSDVDTPTLRILFVISNLEYGGAQRQVLLLANRLHAQGIESHVCCLSDYVPLSADLEDAPRRLHVVKKRSKFDLSVVSRLADLLRQLDVNVVHSFLLDAEIASRLACRRMKQVAVIGSERNTDYRRKWHQTLALRLTQRRLDGVIANSNAGVRFQKRTLGIPDQKLFVVHNGVDVTRFAPGKSSKVRKELGIESDTGVVGMFASFKRQKNHLMLFRAAKRILESHPNTKFFCVGKELHGGLQASGQYMAQMKEAMGSMGLSDAVRLLGNRDDVADVYRACDVTVLTSRREGTPNVLLESMACGVPVVATDVADNALIVPHDRAGYVVELDDDESMAHHVSGLLGDDVKREQMGREARRWVETEFSVDALMRKTTAIYRQLLQRRTGAKA